MEHNNTIFQFFYIYLPPIHVPKYDVQILCINYVFIVKDVKVSGLKVHLNVHDVDVIHLIHSVLNLNKYIKV